MVRSQGRLAELEPQIYADYTDLRQSAARLDTTLSSAYIPDTR